MKILRNKLVVGIACILLALILIFVAAPSISKEQTKTVSVYESAEKIEAGTTITAEMLKLTNIPADNAPANTANLEYCVGKSAISTIYAGDLMTIEKLTDEYIPEDTYALATAKGKLVVSITVRNISSIAAARIQSGDVVTVMAQPLARYSDAVIPGVVTGGMAPSVSDVSGEGIENVGNDTDDPELMTSNYTVIDPIDIEPDVIIYPELQYLEVAAVVASKGENATVNAQPQGDDTNTLPVTVSFYVTEEQAKRLAELEKNGTAYVAFVARGEAALAFIPAPEKVLILSQIK